MQMPRKSKLDGAPRGASHALDQPIHTVDDARLLNTINALDGLSDYRSRGTRDGTEEQSHDVVVAKVFRAWACFLELAMSMESASSSGAQNNKLLVLEARVLSCLKRFLAARPPRQNDGCERGDGGDECITPVWQSWSCPKADKRRRGGGCISSVLYVAVSCFLYLLCRHPTTAMLIMRSGLHKYLLNESKALSASTTSTSELPTTTQECDVKDVLLGIDPFDWATTALCASLKHEDSSKCDVFILPIGARSLTHLLAQRRIPKNEAEELGIEMQASQLPPSPQSPSKTRGYRQQHTKKPARLPSIFRFSTHPNHGAPMHRETKAPCCIVCCCPSENVFAMQVAQQSATRLHFLVRAVVSLAVLLPRASPERKTFLRDGGLEVLKQVALVDHSSDGIVPHGGDVSNPFAMIRAMATAGVRLFTTENPPPTTGGTSPKLKTKTKPTPQTQPLRSALGDKLQAITDQSRAEMVRDQHDEATRQRDKDRTALRGKVQQLYSNAMETRSHLLHSLKIMSTGRMHPAASDQTIVDWLDSFLTIDKKEQQRVEQQEMRQRRLLDLQFQIDERRRRERDERDLMAKNDWNPPDIHDQAKEDAKKDAFLKIQFEMRALQAVEDEKLHDGGAEDELSKKMQMKKREAALEEVRRQQVLAEEARRQAKENGWMAKEDHYYAQKILREKQQKELQAKQAKQLDPIADQQKRILKMRQQDEQRKKEAKEIEKMREEDLLARQRRFIDAENDKRQADRERKARKEMATEEQVNQRQWKQIEDAMEKQRRDEEKVVRANERRQRRQQEKQYKEWQNAWASTYDASGNLYYYNQLTGESQWTNPLWDANTSTVTPTDAAASWQDTSYSAYSG